MTDKSRLNEDEERLRTLLLQGLGGDSVAYHAFLKELSRRLRGFFRRRLTGLPDEVEDLVQECLIAIHNQRQTYDARQPLTAWVHAIAKYKLVDLMRRRARHDLLNDPLDDEMDFATPSDDEASDARRDVGELLAGCPIVNACRSCIPNWKGCRLRKPPNSPACRSRRSRSASTVASRHWLH